VGTSNLNSHSQERLIARQERIDKQEAEAIAIQERQEKLQERPAKQISEQGNRKQRRSQTTKI
jgi:uncharacterized protein YaiL (DUF2058 family)